MKNRMKKALALLVALVLTLSLLPAAVFAAEDVTVTLEVNIRAVAEPEMLAELGVQSPLPGPVTVTVPAGSTVKDVLTQAQKDQGLDIAGLDKDFVTGIGWVSASAPSTRRWGPRCRRGAFSTPAGPMPSMATLTPRPASEQIRLQKGIRIPSATASMGSGAGMPCTITITSS